jgi:hypothetical protein
MRNCRILHTQITPKIRVSTAAIWYDPLYYSPNGHFQYETWCFSDDPQQRSFQVIHGVWNKIYWLFLRDSIKIHRYIAANLTKRFAL